MKTKITSILFLILPFLVLSQGREPYMDSLFLFNEIKLTDAHIKESNYDSIEHIRLKNLVEARLIHNKPVEFKVALNSFYGFISSDTTDRNVNNCIKSLAFVNLLLKMPKLSESELLALLEAKYYTYSIISFNQEEYEKSDAVKLILLEDYVNRLENKSSEAEYNYLSKCYEKAKLLERKGEKEKANDIYAKIYKPMYWKVEGEYRSQILNLDEMACYSILNIRRGDLKLLEITPLLNHRTQLIKDTHKKYIEELGGTYPPVFKDDSSIRIKMPK